MMSLSPTNRHLPYLSARLITVKMFHVLLLLLSCIVFHIPMKAYPADQHPEDDSSITQYLFVGDAFDTTFLQPTLKHKAWSTQQWTEEFNRLQQIGTRALIIQWAQHNNVAFYPTANNRDSMLDRVASAAADSGLDFYTGLALNSEWLKPETLNHDKISNALEENKQVATIIHQHFGNHARFRGWYVPQELTDLFYTDDQRELIIGFFSELTGFIRKFDALKPILASGYTSPEKSHLVKFTMWWMRVFDETGIDTLLFQDGAGTANQKKWEKIAPYVEAISIIDDEYFSGDIWFIAEIFTQIEGPEINNRPFKAVPANFERVAKQLDMLGRFGKKIANYAYFPYMQPITGEPANHLYLKYMAFIKNRVAINKAAAPIGRNHKNDGME